MKPLSSLLFPNDADDSTLDAAWKGIGARRARARRARRILVATPLVAALALLLLFVFRRTPSSIASAPQTAEPRPVHVIALATGASIPSSWVASSAMAVAFDDGSHLELAPSTVVRTLGEQRDPSRVELAVESGTTTFDIKPGGPRAWKIEAGDTTVRVLGTRFIVAREGDRLRVAVERGKVRVEGRRVEGGARDLVAGQEIVIGPRVATRSPPETSGEHAAGSSSSMASPSTVVLPPNKPLTAHLPEGSVAAPPPPRANAGMAEADAARKAGQPREALAILAGVVERHEPDAALAAFTVGKIHSEELGDQTMGASWFERAIALGLPAALDEDAHARVVECHGRGGRLDEAARAATLYEAKFPSGRHLGRVRRWTKE